MSAHDILFPPLPHLISERAERASGDVQLRQFVQSAAGLKDRARRSACRAAFGDRYDDLRRHAGAIKRHTLDHLGHYLERFIGAAERAGARVHVASDASRANEICLRIARERGSRLCVKAKSMVTEEIGLVPALQRAGIETIETDLGEFIVQLDGDAPSHIVTPMIHKNRASVARTFVRELGSPYTEDPERLTAIAREHLRGKFRRADLGISGANFLIAESGSLVVCTNEGNADLSIGLPRTHIAIAGVEKLIPTFSHLPVFLKLLARSATGQAMTVYTTVVTGPRRGREQGGPEDVHIVLVDNGRTSLLHPESRELLGCIRCGACLNACPVFRHVGGGHAYGAVYSGPIGAAITPLLRGLDNYPDLAQASTLCGACRVACPVDIDIPSQLIRLRRLAAEGSAAPRFERWMMRIWSWTMQGERRYRLANRMMRAVMREVADGDWRLVEGWTRTRELKPPARRSFREWWSHERSRGTREG